MNTEFQPAGTRYLWSKGVQRKQHQVPTGVTLNVSRTLHPDPLCHRTLCVQKSTQSRVMQPFEWINTIFNSPRKLLQLCLTYCNSLTNRIAPSFPARGWTADTFPSTSEWQEIPFAATVIALLFLAWKKQQLLDPGRYLLPRACFL